MLNHYSLGPLQAAWRVERGFVNENWVVETTQGRYFLKRRHPELRRPEVIRTQHALMHWLRRRGFPAPRVLPTTCGETFLVLGDDLYEIHTYIAAVPGNPNCPAHRAEAAATLACYHALVRGFAPQTLQRLGDLYSPAFLRARLAALVEAWRLADDPALTLFFSRLEEHAADLAARYAGPVSYTHLTLPTIYSV